MLQEPGDPLDLLDDDGNGTVEICLVEEEEKQGKGGTDNRSGCCLFSWCSVHRCC
jgi:hypothetical protein